MYLTRCDDFSINTWLSRDVRLSKCSEHNCTISVKKATAFYMMCLSPFYNGVEVARVHVLDTLSMTVQ